MQPYVMKQNDKLTGALKQFSNAVNSIETVKCFNGQVTEAQKYSKHIAEAAQWYGRIVNINAQQAGFTQFMGSAMFVQAFYYGRVLVNSHQKTAGEVVTTFMAALSAFSSIAAIVSQLLVLEKGRTAGATLRAIISQVEGGQSSRRYEISIRPESCVGDIVLDNVRCGDH